MKRWFWVIDVAKCENCKNCYLSCKDEYVDNNWPGYSAPQPAHQQKWIKIHTNERGQFPLIDVGYLPQPCQHCDDAPCIKAAKDGAIYKRPDGIVIIDPVKAKDQQQVVKACPYGAISWNEELNLPQKCTFCAHLLDSGWTKTRCMQSCPTGALTVRHVEDSEMAEAIKSERLETYKPELKTNPTVYYKNLYRYTRCFVAGSVATLIDAKEECAPGAVITLIEPSSGKSAECTTDAYGDFKFDDIEENSGKYTLQITYKDKVKIVEVELKKSLNAGVIYI